MRKQHAPKATLFLMELVIVLFFFSICAAICANVFGAAHQMAVNSDALSRGSMEVRSAASCYKAAEGDLQNTARLLNGVAEADSVYVYYDKDWQKVEIPVEKGFALQIEQREIKGEADINVCRTMEYEDDVSDIFSISVKVHAEEGGSAYGTE